MFRFLPFLALHLLFVSPAALPDDLATYQQWVGEMKQAQRGPFKRLRWFCNDGTVHPPKPYPCQERGGGHQHGEWSERTVELRAQGYKIAHLFAGIEPDEFVKQPKFNDTYAQLLIERYLINTGDGWILRRAQFYRGALQEEDERRGARALLEHLIAKSEWIGPRFAAIRIGAQLLPHGQDTASVQKVRQDSADLSNIDRGFIEIRTKIHGSPSADDAERVREYANGVSDPDLRARFEALAVLINKVYQARPLTDVLRANARVFSRGPWLQEILEDAASAMESDTSALNRHRVTAKLLADLRDSMGSIRSASSRLRVLDLSLLVEGENFRASAELRESLDEMTRAQRLQLLGTTILASYGSGVIKDREREALQNSLENLADKQMVLDAYLAELRYFGRVPGWGSQNLRFLFFESMQKLAELEPGAILFIQDQLRGSPLLFFSHILDGLSQDANQLAGVRHTVFGGDIGVGLQALNPGIASGVLHTHLDLNRVEEIDPEGIYLLPETISELPPIAGILTAGEGNPLSHVQLLARNLGIPNVSVDERLIEKLEVHEGERVVLAVSPAGLVQLSLFDAQWEDFFGKSGVNNEVRIRPDLDRLDLSASHFISLDDLRADDSGRTVGPKAAKLGELRNAFPERVASGIAIPFGIFKTEALDRPYKDSSRSIFEWMVAQYRILEQLTEGSTERNEQTEAFREELYALILDTQPSEKFRRQLQSAMDSIVGGTEVGMFVRSDTNVEDLPGFTGAGLNLTLPNVKGFDNLVEGIIRVWASPFTARAFAWRQSHMENPEHVYTSILLLQSVASEKSGVLVTQDLDTGDRNVLSVAVNEGVGGAVDGQAAESLRVDTRDGAVRVLATATAPWLRRPATGGGIDKLPASGADYVLKDAETAQLIAFVRSELPERFPPITDDSGQSAAADVEFGFVSGELQLFQIRPFLESRSARTNSYLLEMDKTLASSMDKVVKLKEVPAL